MCFSAQGPFNCLIFNFASGNPPGSRIPPAGHNNFPKSMARLGAWPRRVETLGLFYAPELDDLLLKGLLRFQRPAAVFILYHTEVSRISRNPTGRRRDLPLIGVNGVKKVPADPCCRDLLAACELCPLCGCPLCTRAIACGCIAGDEVRCGDDCGGRR